MFVIKDHEHVMKDVELLEGDLGPLRESCGNDPNAPVFCKLTEIVELAEAIAVTAGSIRHIPSCRSDDCRQRSLPSRMNVVSKMIARIVDGASGYVPDNALAIERRGDGMLHTVAPAGKSRDECSLYLTIPLVEFERTVLRISEMGQFVAALVTSADVGYADIQCDASERLFRTTSDDLFAWCEEFADSNAFDIVSAEFGRLTKQLVEHEESRDRKEVAKATKEAGGADSITPEDVEQIVGKAVAGASSFEEALANIGKELKARGLDANIFAPGFKRKPPFGGGGPGSDELL